MSNDNALLVDIAKLIPVNLTPEVDLSDFNCSDSDLNDFIKSDALNHQKQNLAQTTCIMYQSKIIGYYSLICDALALEKKEKRKLKLIPFPKRRYDTYPAIKIARMAFDRRYHSQGLGSLMLRIIIGMIWDLNNVGIACRFITVDAYPKAINFYSKNGFERNLAQKKDDTISMRLDIFKYKLSA